MQSSPKITSFSFKVASKCNLNCSYCYVYNKGDNSWRGRSAVMSDQVFESAILKISQYCRLHSLSTVSIVFHGGEPLLAGLTKITKWCRFARINLEPETSVRFAIQTNGIMIDQNWAELFRQESFNVGISLDGQKKINDNFRVDHKGRGTHDRVVQKIKFLTDFGVKFGILSVVQFENDSIETHEHFTQLGASSIGYNLPHYTHDDVSPIFEKYGTTPCADYLLPVMDKWFSSGQDRVHVREFLNIARLVMGGQSTGDSLGNSPYGFIFIEADGEIEGLDILRTSGTNEYVTNLNVLTNSFDDIAKFDSTTANLLSGSVPRPHSCNGCVEAETCSGGYFPHRFRRGTNFENRSVWCEDIKILFSHMRDLLDVPPEETIRRRSQLSDSIALL
jgi:uncharacterized protein